MSSNGKSFVVTYPAGGVIDVVKKVLHIDSVDTINTVETVKQVEYVDHIKGFAQNTQPYNKMIQINVPAGVPIIDEEITLPSQTVEIIAFSVTCSGYGEDDRYDMWVNDQLVFDGWYCSEVKEGLYVGATSWVFTVPPDSIIRLRFYNSSQTSKKLWFGVRMIINPIQQNSET